MSSAPNLRDDLFDLLLDEQFADAAPARIERLPAGAPRPLSFAQRRLWFLDQMGLTGNSYNMPVNLRLLGELDRSALERALREIVNRHETLRSTFHAAGGEPRIDVAPPVAQFPIEVEMLAGVDPVERDAFIHGKTIEENDRVFDLSRQAPFRARLLEFDQDDHVLMMTFHHIAGDGWSIMNFARELSQCYNAFHAGTTPELPPLEIDYADFAAWQRRTLDGDNLDSLLEYWRFRLQDASPSTIPADYPRPAVERFRGAGLDFFIPPDVASKLEALAAQHGATTYMVMLAVFTALLHRYTGDECVTVGSPIANRNRREVEPLIGFFVNALVMSTPVNGDRTFTDVLLQVKDEALGGYAHQDLPFEELVEALRPERSLSRNPLFQIMFAVQQQEAMQPEFPLAGLDVRQVMLGRITVRFDLEAHLWPSNGGLQGFLIYNTDLYAEATIRRLGAHMVALSAAVADDPLRPIRELPLLGARELQSLADLNRTAAEYPQEPVHRLFERRAVERPDAPAIIEGDRVVTYAQLDRSANRVANVLRARGVGPDVPVAISMERSIDLIVAVLGTLKAGGAYLPVDPTYPEARRRDMASAAPVWLASLDDPEIAAAPEIAPAVEVSPDNLAYVSFTSGSTGEPKGVAVPHRGVVRLLWNTNFIAIRDDDAFGHASNVSFDAATFEIWGALTHGARLVIIPRDVALVPERMAALLRRERVTAMFLTATLFNRIVDEAPRAFAHMRTLLVGGEALDPSHVARCLELGPPANLLNGYGPTESTTFACTHPIAGVPEGTLSIPIGAPIANTTAFIADAGLRLTPTGMPGELLIGGDGLARGYLGKPALTAERFLPDPFGERPGARVYRTGDRVRLLPSGAIDYVGRLDRQVKIRGHRIEPGEVEARLAAQPGVREAAVTVREDTPGEKRLVAYVVPDSAGDGATEQVEAWSSLFDQKVYSDSSAAPDPFFNTAGWISSYTNEPIAVEHMRVWATDIVNRVLERRPESVLEIGCGSGMLLFQIAPHCRRYDACDISQVSLDYVQRQMATEPGRFGTVTLRRRAAHEFADVEPAAYDAIILSSIVQYFPGVDYLLDVIRGCLRALKPGGFLFFGDIRNYDLLDQFHASVGRSAAREMELTVSPHFFPALTGLFGEVAAARVYLEAGREHNELTRFRYHAVVTTAPEQPAAVPLIAASSMEDIARCLNERRPGAICFTGLPNARLTPEGGIDPCEVEDLAARLGYRASLCWSAADPARFDAHLWTNEHGERGLPPLCQSPDLRPLEQYCNRPAPASGASHDFVHALQQRIGEQLPQFLRPSAYVVLDTLPRTATGKIDRNALPAPNDAGHARAGDASPRSPIEESLCGIFAALLAIEAAGIHDNFFDLGGHSLLATRLASQIRETFGIELPLQAIFESPTVAGLAGWIEPRLHTEGDDLPKVTPRPPMELVPASFAQRRLWFLDRTRITGAAYNMPANLRMRGPLDRAALRNALNAIVARHEALRTEFHDRDGEPFQVIRPNVTIDLPVVAADRDAERRLAAEEGAAEFRLDAAPLFRARLLALAPEEHVLLLTFHHIVSDGWSMGVFLRELGEIYTTFAQGCGNPLAPLPIQYADFAVWQREWEGAPSWRRQLDYWKGQLRDLTPLRLPVDRARPAAERFRGGGHYFDVPEALVARLNRLNREHGVTMYMTLLAALQSLFFRYTGETRVAVGSPIANRNRGEVEGLIGFFVNAMVLTADFEGDPSFEELLARVRRTALDAFANQDLPFEKLVEELAPERSLNRNPLIQVMFALQQAEVIEAEIRMAGLEVKPLEYGDLTVRFDMEFHLWHKDDRLKGLLLYNTDLFDAATIERLASHYVRLLEAALDTPRRPVSRLALLGEGERRRVLEEWSGEASPYPRRPLAALFEERVAATPDAVAIRDGGETWTYAALNREANRVAHGLLARELGRQRLVAICSGRSAAMVANILGAIKAGAGYLPIDPDTPEPRREAILRDAGVLMVLPGSAGEFADQPDGNPPLSSTPESVAYVCYTSGSTGAPKGILIPQYAVARLVLDTNYVAIRPVDRIAHASNVAFDAATFEIWGALLNGAALVVAPRETVLDPAAYTRFLREARIDILFTTTALFNRMVDADARAFETLRVLLTGGEAGDPQRMRRALEHPPQQPLHVYGPTETTTFATWYPLRELPPEAGTPPIGRPVANTRAYVLDGNFEPVPPGASGELCLGGDGLAYGYLNLPRLTAEKFTPHPFSGVGGERLYRSGDRVRFLADGNIDFVGRLDRQVKLRGFRIEPAEIEARMLEHPAVSDAAVNILPDATGELQIVAYAVPRDSDATAADQVAAWENVFTDHVYHLDGAAEDPLFNTTGWRNTKDGSQIPPAEMRAWAEDIYAHVRAGKPERVLEIGCGTGMLLFALAPDCQHYRGTDVSAASLNWVRERIAERPDEYAHVALSQQPADRLDGIEDDFYDAVILSSVVQYFPDIHYLRAVLSGLERKLRRGGRILLFDVRSLTLLPAFYEWLGEPRSVARETELAVDPRFFAAWRARRPRVAAADVRLQNSPHHNELSRFRYTAVIQLDEASVPVDAMTVPLAELRPAMESGAPAIAAHGIPNARLDERPEAADPEDLRRLAEAQGYRAEFCWSAGNAREFDAVLHRDGAAHFPLTASDDGRPWEEFANNPLFAKVSARVTAELRGFLKERLPDYMIPAHVVVLPSFPMGATGKVDRRALPAPALADAPAHDGVGRPPKTPLEAAVCAIAAELLGRESIDPEANFFDIGGHSLLATTLVSRIEKASGRTVPLKLVFERPTMAQLAEWLEHHGETDGAAPLVPASRDGALPLSYAQERLWFLDRMGFQGGAYNTPVNLRLMGPLDSERLSGALTALIERHEALRTVFRLQDGQPCQVILPPYRPEIVLHEIAPGDIEAGKRLVVAHNEPAFDLENGPVIRFGLLRAEAGEHVLLISAHHIAFDGWSLGVLMREIAELYGGAALTPLPVQYADYAAWQRGWLTGQRLEAQLDYWRRELEELETLRLPFDHPRPKVETFRGEAHPFTLSAATVRALRSFNRTRRATTYMTLLAAFQSLLHRYTGQDRITVGTPIAGRNQVEIENLIGFFVNSLVMSTVFTGAPTFDEVTARVRATTLGAFSHQDVPFERLVEALQPERDLSRNPLFQVLFAVQQAVGELRFEQAGVTFGLLEYGAVNVRFDLELHFWEEANEIRGLFVYNRDLFEPGTIARMAEQLTKLLAAALEQPSTTVVELPLLTGPERAGLLALSAGEPAPEPAVSFLRRFEETAARTPDAEALRFDEGAITYGALNRTANRWSRGLEAGADSIVAIELPRGPEAIVAMLSVLKAGAAYVPVDPSLPEARRRYMLSDSGAISVDWERVRREAAAHSDADPERTPEADSLAYLLYTSGSSGTPKAVAMPHRLLNNLMDWQLRTHGAAPLRTLQFTPLTFDVSFQEILTTLCSGGALHLIPAAEHGDFAALAPRLERDRIARLFMPYTPLRYLLEAAAAFRFPALRQMVTAGEALRCDDALTAFFEGRPQVRLFNHYGPTEAHVVTWHEMAADARTWTDPAPIGRPIQDVGIRICDGHLQLLPRGASGELCISGLMARGYHGRAGLTAASFVPDPAGEPGARMYRTGDLARWQPDGTLAFFGRLDQQLKVRGFRIEPGEIEAVLGGHPQVTRAVVGLAGAGRGMVAAWVEPAAAADAGPALAGELRELCAARLPAYMVPGAFVWVDRMPLTSSGKVQHSALPQPGATPAPQPRPARTAREQFVLDAFAEVLGTGQIGIDDNFFELGGHSLAATRLAARLNVPVRRIFDTPTPAGLARFRGAAAPAALPACIIPVQPSGERTPFFCVAPAGGSPLCYLELARALGDDRPFLGFQSPGLLDSLEPLRTVPEMAAFHIAQMKRVQPRGPYLIGGWSFGGTVAYEMARQLNESGERVALLALLDSGVGDPGHAFRWYNPIHVLAAFYFMAKFVVLLGLPTSWEDLRGLGQWVGVALPPTLREAMRPGRRWKFLRTFATEVRTSLRIFSLNFRAGVAYKPAPIPQKATLFRVPWTFTAEDRMPAVLEQYCRGGLEFHAIDGDHMSIMTKPADVRTLADRLRACLERAEGEIH